ncbi:DNA translocase FtsK 4TM domain-containing protein, partial [Ralstonia solanacearum]
MGLGWFGISSVWLLPLVWRYIARVMAGERGLKGPGTVRVWLATLAALCASAALEALTAGHDAHGKAGGAAGRGLASLFSHMLGGAGAFLLMLGVLLWAAPMVFGWTWRQVLARLRKSGEAAPPQADAQQEDADNGLKPTALGLGGAEQAMLGGHAGAARPTGRQRGIESGAIWRQPAWQPPPRTRESPPQPGEIWPLLNAQGLPEAPPPAETKPAAPAPAAPVKPAGDTPLLRPPLRAKIVSSPFHQPRPPAGGQPSSAPAADEAPSLPAEGEGPAMATVAEAAAPINGAPDPAEPRTIPVDLEAVRQEAEALLAELRDLMKPIAAAPSAPAVVLPKVEAPLEEAASLEVEASPAAEASA